MTAREIKTEKISMIQTVVLSVILPLGYLFAILNILGDIKDVSLRLKYTAKIVMIILPVLYYFAVIKKRKSDVLIDSHKRRIRLSIIIQVIVMLIIFIIPFGYTIFFTNPKNGHWSGATAYYFLLAVIEPLTIHLGGCLINAIFKIIFHKKYNNRK